MKDIVKQDNESSDTSLKELSVFVSKNHSISEATFVEVFFLSFLNSLQIAVCCNTHLKVIYVEDAPPRSAYFNNI